jgi:hypothetical protein
MKLVINGYNATFDTPEELLEEAREHPVCLEALVNYVFAPSVNTVEDIEG